MKKKINISKAIKKMNEGGPANSNKNVADNTFVKKPVVGAKKKTDKSNPSFGELFMYGVKHAFGLNKKKMGGSVKSKKK